MHDWEGQREDVIVLPHLWAPEGPPCQHSPQTWGRDAWPLCPRRDPPVVFVLIFLNKRCYPRQGCRLLCL